MSDLSQLGRQCIQVRLHAIDQLLVALDLAAEIGQHQAQLESALGRARHRADLLERHQESMHRRQVGAQDLRHIGGRHLAPPRTQYVQNLECFGYRGILGCAKRTGHGVAADYPRGVLERSGSAARCL
jgi:hypothetical protein